MAARHFMKRSTLSPTETGIAACLIDGMSDREIAAAMGTSPRTVGAHLLHMREKMGLTTRGMLSVFAFEACDSLPDGVKRSRRFPANPKQVREFIGSHCICMTFGHKRTMRPCDEDVYTLSAHDLLSAFRDWSEAWESRPEGKT